MLLLMLVETFGEQPFETFVRERLFEPLGLEVTVFGDAEDVIPGRASMYATRDGALHPRQSRFPEFVRGAFQAAFLGYGLARQAEGQGLMTEALTAAIGFAFDERRLHRVMANYMPTNERSQAVLRGLGFVVDGYARDYLFINGAWRDHVLTSKTNDSLARPELR